MKRTTLEQRIARYADSNISLKEELERLNQRQTKINLKLFFFANPELAVQYKELKALAKQVSVLRKSVNSNISRLLALICDVERELGELRKKRNILEQKVDTEKVQCEIEDGRLQAEFEKMYSQLRGAILAAGGDADCVDGMYSEVMGVDPEVNQQPEKSVVIGDVVQGEQRSWKLWKVFLKQHGVLISEDKSNVPLELILTAEQVLTVLVDRCVYVVVQR